MIGWQERYFKITRGGNCLIYYKKKFDDIDKHQPSGIFDVAQIEDITKTNDYGFVFTYGNRKFHMRAESQADANIWVTYLQFLHELKSGKMEPRVHSSHRNINMIKSLTDPVVPINDDALQSRKGTVDRNPSSLYSSAISDDEDPKLKKKKKKSKAVQLQEHKYENLTLHTFNHIQRQIPSMRLQDDLSEQALIDKGIANYVKSIEADMISSRVQYGFLNKRSTGKVKFFQRRWFFMISSRPLNLNKYLNDARVMDESLIPPLLELDTLY